MCSFFVTLEFWYAFDFKWLFYVLRSLLSLLSDRLWDKWMGCVVLLFTCYLFLLFLCLERAEHGQHQGKTAVWSSSPRKLQTAANWPVSLSLPVFLFVILVNGLCLLFGKSCQLVCYSCILSHLQRIDIIHVNNPCLGARGVQYDHKNVSTICFWRNIVLSGYSVHYISCSSGTTVSRYCTTWNPFIALTGHCTYSQSQKYIYLRVLKPCRLNVSFTRCSDVRESRFQDILIYTFHLSILSQLKHPVVPSWTIY